VLTGLLLCNAARPARASLLPLWVSCLALLLLLLLWVSCLPLLLLLLLWVSCLPLLLQPGGGGCRSLLAPCLPLLLAFTSLTLLLPPVNLLRLQQ